MGEVQHDGNVFTCYSCCAHWPNAYGSAEFFDDHGDLSAGLAEWEARRA